MQLREKSTATSVATELGEFEKTIGRNGQQAELHDAILEASGDEAAEIVKGAHYAPSQP